MGFPAVKAEIPAVEAPLAPPPSGGGKRPTLAEMRALFTQAQRNISQLNQSRLRALEELDAARRKIAALGGCYKTLQTLSYNSLQSQFPPCGLLHISKISCWASLFLQVSGSLTKGGARKVFTP